MVELDRRQFLAGAAATVAAAPLGTFGRAGAQGKADRELAAIGRATEWLNSSRLVPDSLAGKVVLVDFCTYTCINWLRTLPYVRTWAHKYAKGLVVIGVHTPEFGFEKNIDNVHGGGVTVEASGVEAAADWENLRSPENYVGYNRTQHFASPGGVDQDRRAAYAIPPRLSLNEWALAGEWTIGGQATTLNGGRGRIAYRFHARDLHLVMGPATRGATVRIRVSVDGRPPGPGRGLDVDENGNGEIVEQRLYQLIRQPKPIGDRTFEIAFDSGVETLAFAFG